MYVQLNLAKIRIVVSTQVLNNVKNLSYILFLYKTCSGLLGMGCIQNFRGPQGLVTKLKKSLNKPVFAKKTYFGLLKRG